MAGVTLKRLDSQIILLLAAATAITALLIIIVQFVPLANKRLFYDIIQLFWPMLSIIMLLYVSITAEDHNIRHVSRLLAFALVPWTLTLFLWEVFLPAFLNEEIYYYVSGFGFLLCYVIILYGLVTLKESKQWYITPSTNSYINIIAAIATIAVLLFVFVNIRWDSPRLPDVLILLLYLIADIAILAFCSKLINMNLKVDLKYLIFVVTEFTFINSVGDLLFMARWLVGLRQILGMAIGDVTDIIYNASLIFMAVALLIYVSGVRSPSFARLNRSLDGRMMFVDDIVAHSPDAMFVCDRAGKLLIVNEPLLRFFNASRSEIPGQFNLFDHLARHRTQIPVDMAPLQQGKVVLADRMALKLESSGRACEISVKVFPLSDPSGAVMGYAGIIEDTTERLETEKVLKESRDQVELLMDIMGHDINNMNQIGMGFLELARDRVVTDGKIGQDDVSLLDLPMSSFRNSGRLIDTIRKIQNAREHEVPLEPVDVGAVLQDAIEELKGQQGRDITIQYGRPARTLVYANALLKDVFINLIGNSIKHSPPDRLLRVDICVDSFAEAGKPYCRVSIEDNGPGIPDDIKDKVFNRLLRGTSKAKGLGLGLYLVKSLVESYNGRVWVEDRVQGDHTKGCRFVVVLPSADQ